MDNVEPMQLVGQFRRLGETGPIYEVIGLKDNGKLAEIEIPESGEKATLTVDEVLANPKID